MNMGTGFTKSKAIIVVVAAVAVIALVVTMAVVLKGCKNDLPAQGDGTTQTAPTDSDTPSADTQADTFIVTFKDYDGTVLDTQKVEKGESANAPADPARENFTFEGWDKAFDKVTSDLVVTATYTTTKTVIYAEHVTVDKSSGEASINIRVINNPGIMGAVLKVSVDDKVFSFKEGKKTEHPGLTLTSPGSDAKTSPYTFMLDALELQSEDKKDGILFSLTFKINDTAASGKYDVKLSYDKGAVFDEAYKTPKVYLENGSVTVK
ncbi:MAG: InlB B-repeat-containing protein [Clostridia bacterium]|nr:InlB B-repeat-containing protein [Clostridia bacterium]